MRLNDDWTTASAESQGIFPHKLEVLKESLAAKNTKSLLIIRHDKIVHEWYAPGHSATTKHYTASMAKALVGGVSLAVVLSEGRLALDDKTAKYVPQWQDDPMKSRITIRHLGSHTSGLEDAEVSGLPHDRLTGWKGDFWKRHDPPHDPFTISRDLAPVLFEAGQKMRYSNPGIAMLSYAVSVALKDALQKDIRSLLRDRVMRPIGLRDEDWSVGYGRTFTVDGLPLVASWGGGNYTARAVARVGRLMLHQGNWEGKQLIDKDAVYQTTSDAGAAGNCGMGWWSNNKGKFAKLPKDAFWGSGAGHQVVLVVPSLNLIAVRNGENLSSTSEYHEALYTHLFAPLMEAIAGNDPMVIAAASYPPSPVIKGITWAPKETIIRQAHHSDCWPITWGDDDHLYTAYGDGYGFEPKVPEKLSLGLAKVSGSPPDFTGVNIRSPSGERKGDGAKGLKASGMLMVNGVLYMWVRNVGNSQLAWSTDYAKTWTWSHWKFTASFGYPTFLNFGKNYAEARDDYVYVYSHDSDSAYTPADRMLLARVPKDQIANRDACEFFKELAANGAPLWTKDIAQRGAVFTHLGRCYRSGISYNAALKRYLWCQIILATVSGGDTRFSGGFGIYDAPELWGPWTTVYFTEQWDVGPGETSSFPTKWMSADGKTVHLLFSGDDYFSVRQATLIL